MSFKGWVGALFLLLPLVLLGCAEENQPAQREPKILGEGYCLESLGNDLSKYFRGQLTPVQVEQLWNCADDAVLKFLEYTRGSQVDGYSGDDFYRFLKKFFLGGSQFSPQFVVEMMEVKRVFLGGSNQQITRRELQSTKELIKEFKARTLELNPYLPVLHQAFFATEKTKEEISPMELEVALSGLRDFAQNLSRVLSARPSAYYEFEHLTNFIREINYLMDPEKREKEDSGEMVRYVPLIRELKGVLIGLPLEKIQPSEWTSLFQVMFELLSAWNRYAVFIKFDNWSESVALEQGVVVIQRVFDLLGEFITRKPSGHLPLVELNRVIDEAAKIDLLPLGLNSEQAQKLLYVLVNRLLAVDSGGERLPPSENLSMRHLDNLRHEFNFWKSAQDYCNSIVRQLKLISMLFDPAAEEMRFVASGPWPLVIDNSYRLTFNLNNPLSYDQVSLTRLNWQRAAIRVLIRSYAEDPGRRRNTSGLLENELAVAAVDLAPLGAALGLYDEDNTDIYKRIFAEGNMFMPRSNGDRMLDFTEGVEYLAFALSGKSTASLIFERLKQECGEPVSISCYREKLIDWPEFFDHLPNLKSYLSGPDRRGLWLDYNKYLEITIRGSYSIVPLEYGDLIQMMILAQYIETFFGRFDGDKSTTIRVNESLNAYSMVYKGPLSSILDGFGDDTDVLALFTYLFKFGNTPFNDGKIGGGVRFQNWKWHPEKWVYEANRTRLLQILATLNSL